MRAARLTGIAGQSKAVARLLEQVVKLAGTNLPILIVGERAWGAPPSPAACMRWPTARAG